MQCRNNLKQIGTAVSSHIGEQRALPFGGWGWGWSGDPDRGFSGRQPGGWLFNILPFTELKTVHDFGKNGSQQGRTQTAQTIVPLFSCPAGRPAVLTAYAGSSKMANIDPNVQVVAKADYAGNGGDNYTNYTGYGPDAGGASDVYSKISTYAPTIYCEPYPTASTIAKAAYGVFYQLGSVKVKDIKVGTAHVYLAGEKYLNPDHYLDSDNDDDQPWTQGFDIDTIRFTNNPPLRNQRGVSCYGIFGGVHPASFNMLFGDGAVHSISYEIDPVAHRTGKSPG